MFVHLVEAIQHGAEIVRADGDHSRQPDGRIHGISSTYPVAETEHVVCVNAELCHFLGIGRDRDAMFGDRPRLAVKPSSNQSCAVCAFVIVSSVVKVFEEMTNCVAQSGQSHTR